jgi:membrane-associated phospholipid phosphatase
LDEEVIVFVLFACFALALMIGLLSFRAMTTWLGHDAGAPHVDDSTVRASARRHVVAARWLRAHLSPAAATGSALVAVAVVTILGAACVGILLAMVHTHRGFARLDASATRFGAAHATATSTYVLRQITQLGGAVVLVPVALLAGVVESRRKHSWSSLAFLAVVFGGQLALAELIRAAVSRARPDLLRLTGFAGPSFPSGHATMAAAMFAAFALLFGRGRCRTVRSALAGAAAGMAVLVAATRVILGVHWLTDVMAGLSLGWMWFAVVSIAFGGRRLRFGDPVAKIEDEAAAPSDRYATT